MKNTGWSTASEVWAALAGLALGLALSCGFRWGRRHQRTRAILIPLGANLAALALLGAVLASGAELGALPARWSGWLWPLGVAALVGTVAFRFPRAAGLPVLVLAGLSLWFVAGALKEFSPLDPLAPTMTVQPLTDREVVTIFAWRADFVALPSGLPVPVLYRLRPGVSPPPEWWWPWAVSRGLAASQAVAPPTTVLKYGVYRLALRPERPAWTLFLPELAVPDH